MSQVSGLAALPVLGSMPEIRRLNQADFSEFGLNDYVCTEKGLPSALPGRDAGSDVVETTIICLASLHFAPRLPGSGSQDDFCPVRG